MELSFGFISESNTFHTLVDPTTWYLSWKDCMLKDLLWLLCVLQPLTVNFHFSYPASRGSNWSTDINVSTKTLSTECFDLLLKYLKMLK